MSYGQPFMAGAQLDQIFKAYDIRGTVPDQIDASVCGRIGAAFARFTGASSIVMARDMRPSGVELSAAFAEGAMAQGADVVDLGLASTDLIYYAAGKLDVPGAMFTASHNPAGYNGIKLCLPGAKPVGEETGLVEIKALVEQAMSAGDLPSAEQRGSRTELDLVTEYAAHVRSFVDVASLTPLTVIADTANGMGGYVAPRVFEGLPFDVEYLFPELDGTFPNHPADPINHANLTALRARVTEAAADIGLAFDGDADRVVLVDEGGRPISGSLTTALLAAVFLDRNPGSTILYNAICSKAVPEVILEHGGVPVRTRVGHSFIKQVMLETGAVFGGEHSAHYYFRDNYRADSGLIASVLVLEQLCITGRTLSELLAPLDRYADSGEINSKVTDPQAVIKHIADHYATAKLDWLDGLTVDLDDWWFNVRASNTEPLLRLNLEARTRKECEAHTDEVLAMIREN